MNQSVVVKTVTIYLHNCSVNYTMHLYLLYNEEAIDSLLYISQLVFWYSSRETAIPSSHNKYARIL